jgi:hypothetical protein
VVDHEFEAQLCQTEDYEVGICCFVAGHAALSYKTGWNEIRIMCQSEAKGTA